MRLAPSPIIALNRAVAICMAKGPLAAMDLITPLAAGPLSRYAPAHAAKGEVLARLGETHAAALARHTALAMTHQPDLRRHLQRRLQTLAEGAAKKDQNSFEIGSVLASFG